MNQIDFINVDGAAVNLEAKRAAAPKRPKGERMKRVDDRAKAKQSLGFEVVGVPVEARNAARAAAEKLGQTFDEAAWLAHTKPKRAMPRFNIPQAADTAAAMLRAGGGWLEVRVREALKG